MVMVCVTKVVYVCAPCPQEKANSHALDIKLREVRAPRVGSFFQLNLFAELILSRCHCQLFCYVCTNI